MSILTDIIDWVETKPQFWQYAIDKLIRNNNLTPDDLSLLKEICKAETGLSKAQFAAVDFGSLRAFISHSAGNDNVILSKIHNIENINALSRTSVLEFAPTGLTAVYGDNGAGKSSYVSVLKHTCNTRGQKPPINDNLYDAASRGTDKRADVEFTTDGVTFNTVKLKNAEVSNSTLKSIDVFDSFSANHYIENEDEIAFIPQGLSFIEKFAVALKLTETEFNNESQGLESSKLNLQLLQVDEGIAAKIFLDNLNSQTTLDDLRAHSQWHTTSDGRVIELKKIIADLKATDPAAIVKSNEQKIERFKVLKNKFQSLENSLITRETLDSTVKIAVDYATALETLKASSEDIFSGLPLTGIGDATWKQLWESARKFYNTEKGENVFPETDSDSACPLCLQKLDDGAKKRFVNFEEFVKHDLQQVHDNAEKAYDDFLLKTKNLSFIIDDHEPTIVELEAVLEGYRLGQSKYLEALSSEREKIVALLAEKKAIETLPVPELEINSRTVIEEFIAKLEANNIKLRLQSIEEDLKPFEIELLELINQKRLYDFKPQLAREIYRQKKVALLNQCYSKCATRTVTTLSNSLAASYISQNLKDNFQAELVKLGFKNIKIETETKGAKGKQYHYLRLDEPNSHNVALKDILSEGEHRCIALSTFLSELSLSDHKSAIVFDDPVSSLDHKWRNKIARRIVEESTVRQVIVFSHDITFLLMLQEHAKQLQCALEIKSLTRKKNETGIIASNPPWDALPINRRIGILKSEQQKLDKIERTQTEEIYREAIKPLYGLLRETWERFVEEVLLDNIIQRFGREIQTKRLSKLVDLTAEDYKKVDENMGKCSTYFLGHDSAGTLIEEMPDAAEFLADILILENFAKVVRARRSK